MCIKDIIIEKELQESTSISMMNASQKKMVQMKSRKLRRQAMQKMGLETKTLAEVSGGLSGGLSGEMSTTPMKKDFIAVSTAQFRKGLQVFNEMLDHFASTKAYKILFKTTQPAHFLTMISIAIIAVVVYPKQGASADEVIHSKNTYSPLMSFIYLFSLSVHFGFQMWMTFISGLSLYFALPRHTFGGVQRVLFPMYFGCNSFLSIVTLIVFVKLQTAPWDGYIISQVSALAVCFLVELTIRLYLTPPLLQLMTAKNELEKAAGVGLEVGEHSVGSLALCPHYLRLHLAFRKVHMTVAAGNILAMACNTYHLCYLSTKICLTI